MAVVNGSNVTTLQALQYLRIGLYNNINVQYDYTIVRILLYNMLGFQKKYRRLGCINHVLCDQFRQILNDLPFQYFFPFCWIVFIYFFLFKSTPDIIYDLTTRVWWLLAFHQ